jgi:hypothetical protein
LIPGYTERLTGKTATEHIVGRNIPNLDLNNITYWLLSPVLGVCESGIRINIGGEHASVIRII